MAAPPEVSVEDLNGTWVMVSIYVFRRQIRNRMLKGILVLTVPAFLQDKKLSNDPDGIFKLVSLGSLSTP